MLKRALFAVTGFLGLCVSLSAQQALPEQFHPFSSLEGSWATPSLALENQDHFFFSTGFGSMRSTQEYLPAYSWQEAQSDAPQDSPPRRGKSLNDAVDWSARTRLQFGGEVGFLYGKSSGKYGREDFSSYFIGTVGNEYFSITAGYSHQETNGRYPRWRR